MGGLYEPSEPTRIRMTEPNVAHRARLTVCARAKDAGEARELLSMLGLLSVEKPAAGKVGTNTRDFASRRHGMVLSDGSRF
jgi:hypothetical protein